MHEREYLRANESLGCLHRIELDRTPGARAPRRVDEAQEKRQHDADSHRTAVLSTIAQHQPDALDVAGDAQATLVAINEGRALILRPHLVDHDGLRQTSVQALVRTGKHNETAHYAPLIIRNHEVFCDAASRTLMEGSLTTLSPADVTEVVGIGLRPTETVRRDGIILSSALDILARTGAGDPSSRGGVVDRQGRLWWLDLEAETYPRANRMAYRDLYGERLALLRQIEDKASETYVTAPYWHRDCPHCPYSERCHDTLAETDHVSLVRFTNARQQRLLAEQGITTRRQLAQLDPASAKRARLHPPTSPASAEESLSPSFERLDDLIYRSRCAIAGTPLRIVDRDALQCPTADIEVDVDMESYNDRTYLWGARVRTAEGITDVTAEHRSFVTWDELTAGAEAAVFDDFWTWFCALRALAQAKRYSFAAYCFWAQAENGAMDRAAGSPDMLAAVHAFREETPRQWIDIHEVAQRQLQTDGPTGLKQLATVAGFAWRDHDPSGEASMRWYEIATSDTEEAPASRQRLLDYNEDDCHATAALRDWLNGEARQLGHRDDPLGPIH